MCYQQFWFNYASGTDKMYVYALCERHTIHPSHMVYEGVILIKLNSPKCTNQKCCKYKNLSFQLFIFQ